MSVRRGDARAQWAVHRAYLFCANTSVNKKQDRVYNKSKRLKYMLYTGIHGTAMSEHAQQRVFLAQPCEGDLHLTACTRKSMAQGRGQLWRHTLPPPKRSGLEDVDAVEVLGGHSAASGAVYSAQAAISAAFSASTMHSS